jgi:hypothetical protein
MDSQCFVNSSESYLVPEGIIFMKTQNYPNIPRYLSCRTPPAGLIGNVRDDGAHVSRACHSPPGMNEVVAPLALAAPAASV